MPAISRRSAIQYAAALAATPGIALPYPSTPNQELPRILVAGGHPDDTESAYGGTMIKYAALGCSAAALHLTRGEAARIRTDEVQRTCGITGAKPVFLGQIDGSTEINRQGRFMSYYFEVLTGDQSQHFRPTHYVDISDVTTRKRDACYAHQSQKPGPQRLKMSEFRGLESQVAHAGGFFQQDIPGDIAY